MSFILDALKKSEIERQRQTVPGLMDARGGTRRSRLPVWAVALGVLLGINLVVLSFVLLRKGDTAAQHPAVVRVATERAAAERVADFAEVTGGLTAAQAGYEAARCLSCGNCFECDGCLGACPEDAVIKLGPGHRYQFDYDHCTGCGACADQCPVHAIEMEPEEQ